MSAREIIRCYKDCSNEKCNGESETVRLMVKKDEKVVMKEKVKETEGRDERNEEMLFIHKERTGRLLT